MSNIFSQILLFNLLSLFFHKIYYFIIQNVYEVNDSSRELLYICILFINNYNLLFLDCNVINDLCLIKYSVLQLNINN